MINSEFKKRYDHRFGKYVKKHIYTGEIYGGGLMDIFKSIGSKLFGKTTKEIAKKAAITAVSKAATKTGEHLGNKAGDKIIQLLRKKQPTIQPTKQPIIQPNKPLTEFELAECVNQLISGGKLKKRMKFM